MRAFLLISASATTAAAAFLLPTARWKDLSSTVIQVRGGAGGRGSGSGCRKGLNNRRGNYGENGEPKPKPKKRRSGSRAKKRASPMAEEQDDSDNEPMEEYGDAAAASLLRGLGFDNVMEAAAQSPPQIVWGPSTEAFFWGSDTDEQSAQPLVRISNNQDWPLLHYRGYLSPRELEAALILARRAETSAEEVEQFEPDGTLIRRSRVVTLAPPPRGGVAVHAGGAGGGGWSEGDASTLREVVLGGLPTALKSDLAQTHPFEDASLVFYDGEPPSCSNSSLSFYDVHHDSWFEGDPLDVAHRAYTLLVYLHSPSDVHDDDDDDDEGDGESGLENGGTQFPRLLQAGQPVTLRPAAGDALLWPNFSRDGTYSTSPVHAALPLVLDSSKSRSSARLFSRKAVINVWFHGKRADLQ